MASLQFSRADEPGSAIVGHARFTVITPNLIRMEYAADGNFVDDPSWFAVNRKARDAEAVMQPSASGLDLNTGEIHLVYHDNGQPFSPENLRAEIKQGGSIQKWKPGQPSLGNLGGTIRTLDSIHGPVPLGEGVISRDGWYLLDDSRSDLFRDGWIVSRANKGNQDWYLFGYGLDYHAALRSLTTIGGAVPLPRKYTLGIWYSRYWPYSADEFKKIVQQYADHGFPLDMLVLDMDWHLNAKPPGMKADINTWTGYTWDRKLIPDPIGLIQWLHDQGLHVTLNDHPSQGVQPHEEMYSDFMHAMGQDPASQSTIPFDAGSKHYLDTFYQFTHQPREKEGVDFWWLDWQQEPATRSIPDLTNLAALNYYNYTRTEGGGLRGQSFSRWAGWGDQRYPIEFSGDAQVGWPMLAFEIPFTSTAGNMGAFFWSHDIGGHWGGRDEESYARWCQFGAFTAALRSHSTRNATMDRRPWTYSDWAEKSMRVSFRLRAEMMPYLYTSIAQGVRDSTPYIRPLYLDHPEAEDAYHNGQEYTFGDNLLLAPITMPGVGPNRLGWQAVWFPDDDWYDFFTGEKFTGPSYGLAAAPINEFPLYLRGGVPLPMQTFTSRPGSAPLTELVLRCYPGRDGKLGKSTVYEDDGVTPGYEKGESATTPLSYLRHGSSVTVTIGATTGHFQGEPETRACIIELPCTAQLTSCDHAQATTSYDVATLTNRIELPAASVRKEITLKLTVAEIPPEQVAAQAVQKHVDELMPQGSSSTPEMQQALAAAHGVGLMALHLHPYFLGHAMVARYFHNHSKAADQLQLKIGDTPAHTASLINGQSVLPVDIHGMDQPSADSGLMGAPMIVSLSSLPDAGGATLTTQIITPIAAGPDLALQAKTETSSGNGQAAIDNVVQGYPVDQSKEWVTERQKEGAWIKLIWPQAITANQIFLYDRPNPNDQVLAGTLEFSDGSKVDFGPLPNAGDVPGCVTFPAKSFQSVKITITRVSPTTENAGLAEIGVFQSP